MDLGDRMKLYESMALAQAMPKLPLLVRLDGKCFHKLTKQCDRPFDASLHNAMVETARTLARETSAKAAYTQSDEITLLLYADNPRSQVYFDGKYHKINSVLGGMAATTFNKISFLSEAHFDSRTWTVPTQEEAANVFVWREQDASRNSVQMAARSVFSHKQCHLKNSSELQEMLHSKGINWNDYDAWAKRGTYILRRVNVRELSDDERAKIPEKHRPEPGHTVERTDYEVVNLPVLTTLRNRVGVLFMGEQPELHADKCSDRNLEL